MRGESPLLEEPRSSKSILIAGNEPLLRQLIAELLQDEGYVTSEAADGLQTIERLRTATPDLLLLDIMMPKVEGWGVLAHLHTLAAPPRVIVMTGLNEIIPPGRLGEHVSGYLVKPFRGSQLLRACAAALDQPPLVGAEGTRREPRRAFTVETLLLSEDGTPLTFANLVQVSLHGFQLEAVALLRPGDPVQIQLQLPGREALRLRGRVRWRQDRTVGAEIEDLQPDEEEMLKELIGTQA